MSYLSLTLRLKRCDHGKLKSKNLANTVMSLLVSEGHDQHLYPGGVFWLRYFTIFSPEILFKVIETFSKIRI